MRSWSDWKDDEKLEAALRSLVATNLKNKEIFVLVSWDFPDYEWSLWTLDQGFWHIQIFRINYDTPKQILCLRQFMLNLIAKESYKNTEY